MSDEMKRFEHGGDVYSHAGAIDFSANLNPLGMPDEVIRAVREQVPHFDVYPDMACRELRGAIAEDEGVPASWIVCTAGATDLMHRICLALKPSDALVTAPCFSGYEQALEQAQACIWRHRLLEEEGFELTERILLPDCADANAGAGASAGKASPSACRGSAGANAGETSPSTCADIPTKSLGDVDVVFLCTPNNPTGLTIERGLLERILEQAHESGTVVVLDECFLDFTGERSAVDLCTQFDNLVVMKAFTKIYAMAGLRLGYGICSDAELIERLEAEGQPWIVSGPAQCAGVAALRMQGWKERTRAYVDEQRAQLAAGLEACGMRVVPGKANYLLFKSDCELYAALLERGFLIRRCANYEGLDERWYRVAVRTEEENAALIAALRDVRGLIND